MHDDDNKVPSVAEKRMKVISTLSQTIAVSQLQGFLDLGPNIGKNIPSLEQRSTKEWESFDEVSRSRMISFLHNVVDKIVAVILPKDPQKLKKALWINENDPLKDNVLKLVSTSSETFCGNQYVNRLRIMSLRRWALKLRNEKMQALEEISRSLSKGSLWYDQIVMFDTTMSMQ